MRSFKYIKVALLAALLLPATILLNAQSATDLRINEFLVENDSNYIDDFGQHSPWVEFFNTAHNTVNMGGLYLTNDLNNPKMYMIPKGDPITAIAPRCFLVFWADGKTEYGIRHLNFNLKDSKIIALFDADGKTLIDKIEVGNAHKKDVTFGRVQDGDNQWGFLDKSTPGASNFTGTVITAAEKFGKMDPSGAGMAVIAMGVVFFALALLYLFFKQSGKIQSGKSKRFNKTNKKEDNIAPITEASGEVNAAIATALFLYRNQLHDHENTIITIQKVARSYSPWSSKIYGVMNNWPTKTR